MTPSPAFHRFKILLCPKFLVDITNDGRSRVDERPKVQARAQPRAVRLAQDPAAARDKTLPTSDGGLVSHYSKYPLPEYSEIRRLMETTISASSTNFMSPPLLLKIKFELFNSYAALQSEIPKPERDPEWVDCLQSGNLTRTLDLAFGGEPCKLYRESLEQIVRAYILIQ
jgi:hypothetical protein